MGREAVPISSPLPCGARDAPTSGAPGRGLHQGVTTCQSSHRNSWRSSQLIPDHTRCRKLRSLGTGWEPGWSPRLTTGPPRAFVPQRRIVGRHHCAICRLRGHSPEAWFPGGEAWSEWFEGHTQGRKSCRWWSEATLVLESESVSHLGSVVSDSLWPHGLQPAKLLCPWDSPGNNTGVGCHALLQGSSRPGDGTRISTSSTCLPSSFIH